MPMTTNPRDARPDGAGLRNAGSRTGTVARPTFTEIARTPSMRLTALILVLAAAGVTVWAGTSWRAPSDRRLVDTLAVLIGMVPPLLGTLLYVGSSLTRDLANGTLASLLSTAVGPREAVRGTTLAVYLPGLPLVLAVPIAIEAASGHARTVTVPLVVGALVLTPMVGWALTALTVRLAIARGPEIALVPTWLVSVAMLMGVPVGSLLGGVDVASWAFLACYAVGAACLGLAVWGTSPALTRERVTLAR